MIFDTDVLIWCFRGDPRAAKCIQVEALRRISAVTLMELLQGARNQREQRLIRQFLRDLRFEMLPLSDHISHRAVIYLETHALTGGLQMADSLIAATAMEHGDTLCTGNAKHYRVIKDLPLDIFRPTKS